MIQVEDVYFTYPPGVEALRGVSLTINNGEFIAIMGENGAGKTTLVKHFNGLLRPSRGRVLVDGVETSRVSVASLSRKVGLVFQNPDRQLFCESVEKEIAFGLRNFGFAEDIVSKRIDWALNLLDLMEYREVSPFMLSGGERKRVALASVLAWDPEAVILDEPTIGQDHGQKERLRQFITQLNTQGKIVVVVTHDVEFVADSRPRVVLMSRGRIIADGSCEEVLSNRDLLGKASILPPQVTQIVSELADLGLRKGVIDLYEAGEVVASLLRRDR